MRFGDYAPENFDKRYRGQLTAREALQLSLNLPAVALLDRLGPMRLVGTLEAAGTPLRLPDAVGAPGLPIALGGAGITLADLVTLYAGLADGGSVLPLRYTDTAPAGEPVAIMQPSSAWYLHAHPRGHAAAAGHAGAPQSRAGARRSPTRPARPTASATPGRSATTAPTPSASGSAGPMEAFSPGRMGRDAAAPVLFEVFDLLPRPHGQPGIVFAATPPAGVLQASNADLPLPLRRFDPGPSALDALFAAGDRPQIAFPADRATVDLSAGDGRLQPLLLRANGGRMPLLWLVNGVPVASAPFKRQAQYRPDGAGATRITVIDSAGAAASVEVWI